MNSQAARSDARGHREMQQLLPWLLAGTLERAESDLVQAHVQACPQCQADLDFQRRLRDAARQPAPAIDPERALARLLPCLAAQAPRAGELHRFWRRMAANDNAWLRWTAAAQLAVIGVLGVLLVRGDDGAAYQALGSPLRAQGAIVVVFRPETPERELRRIVQASGARVVDGPTVTDAYVLDVPAGRAPRALVRLRAEPAVTLAQPLDGQVLP